MLILTIRTDNPEAELGLYEDQKQLAYLSWPAHRQLAESIHVQMQTILESQDKQFAGVDGIVVFEGPGSFTGLRIGISVANALAAGLAKPIVGAQGDDWQAAGIRKLINGKNQQIIAPFYGALPNITLPKK